MEGLLTDLPISADTLDCFICALSFTHNADLYFGGISFVFHYLLLSMEPD
jgi:hypothetical protein